MAPKAPLYLRYHQRTLISGSSSELPTPPTPQDAAKIFFKAYSRFPHVPLPEPCSRTSPPLQKVIFERRTSRGFSKESPLQLSQLSRLLAGLQITGYEGPIEYDSRRAYPSAGSCYPLETYILPLRVEGLKRHLHHYHVRTHALEELWPLTPKHFRDCFPKDSWCIDASAVVILTACHTRSYRKYLERAYQYCLLEAGQAAQNLHLLATAEGLNSCSYGGFCDEALMRLLDINPNEEIPLHTILLGKPNTDHA